MLDEVNDWVWISIGLALIAATLIVAYRTQGGIKKPAQLLILTIITISYVFSLTFIQGITPQLGLDLRGGVSVVLEAKGKHTAEELDTAVDVIRSRVDALGVAEPDINRQGNNIIVDLPGVKNAQRAQELIGATAELRFRQVAQNLDDPGVQAVLTQVQSSQQKASTKSTKKTTTTTNPSATSSVTITCGGTNPTQVTLTGDLTKPTPRADDKPENPIIAVDDAGAPYLLCPTILKGDIVKSAYREIGENGNVVVGVELTSKGGSQFTQKIGAPLSNQSVAIVLDSKVISAPVIQPELANGLTDNKLQITVNTGNSTKEVDNLITVLKYGRLPVVLEQQTAQKVSATLGTDQLRAGLIAGAIGLLLVFIYMLLYYRILALVVLTGITLTGMTVYALICFLGQSQGLSLTLAGAVGLIVSLGVTVDSYVVYFEKLKDEVKQGRTIRSCLDPAFKASFKTILAADLVSIIGAAALFYLAAGSVRGFAFFLGVSTVLDLAISYCFMHPMVKLMAQSKRIITGHFYGMAAALDKKDLEA